MHRLQIYKKHSRITKYGLPQSPAFRVSILKGLFSLYFIHIYIYRSLHVAYNDTRNHLGRCHSVPCKKKYTREILNITWGRPVRQAQLHRCSRFCTTRRRPKHKKQEFTRCFYKLLAKGDYYIFKHLSSIRLDFPDAVCRGFNWI